MNDLIIMRWTSHLLFDFYFCDKNESLIWTSNLPCVTSCVSSINSRSTFSLRSRSVLVDETVSARNAAFASATQLSIAGSLMSPRSGSGSSSVLSSPTTSDWATLTWPAQSSVSYTHSSGQQRAESVIHTQTVQTVNLPSNIILTLGN